MARAAEALAGLGVAAAIFAGAGGLLRDSAQAEPFRVEVEAPARVVPASEGLRWRGRVLPAALASRVEVWVDGSPVVANITDGSIEADLGEVGPGHHLVEVGLTQQGGRSQTVTDTLLVGPFAGDMADGTGCSLSLTIAEAAIQRLVIPALRERLLTAARDDALLGPDTTLERAELTLLADAVRVRVALAGVNTVGVDAYLKLQPAGPRGLALSLVWLGPVEFHGRLRTQATVGAAAVGAALTGPLAPLGAVAGYVLADRYVGKRAHAEVREQLRRGLEQAANVPLLPASAELLPGHPRSAVSLALCGPVEIGPGVGISTRLSLRSPGLAGAVYRGVVLPEPDLSDMSDVRLDLSIDAVNALLHAWTDSGLLADRMAAADWAAQVDRALQEWTLLSLAGVEVTRAPVLMAAGQGSAAPDGDAWALSFGGLVLDLRGGEAAGTVVAAGRGWVTPRFDAATGRLELGGAVDRLRLTCVDGAVLRPCFGALLELGEVEARLDAILAPGTGRLPGIDVRGLLQARTRALRPEGLDVEDMAITVPAGYPGVLRVRARLR